MLLWGTGFDLMKLSTNASAAFAQLGWYGLPGGPAPAKMRILNTNTAFGYGNALEMDNTSVASEQTQASYLLKNGVTATEWRQGARMYVPSGQNYMKPFIGIGKTGTCLMSVMFSDFGQIELWLGRPHKSLGTLLATSDPGTYLEDTWNYLELGGLLINTTAGYVTVRLNTVEVIAVVSTITSAGSFSLDSFMVGFGEDSTIGVTTTGVLWDDMYIVDTSGPDNNDWLGNIRVQGLVPDAPGASTDWTPFGAATNWQAASNTDIDDTKYVFSGTATDHDLYNVTPLINTPQVFGVQITGFYRQDDATQRSVANTIQSNGVDAEGVEFFTPGNYAAATDMWESDPDTSDPWLYPAVNLLQIGPLVKS